MVDESKLDPVVGGMIRDGHRTSGDSEGAFERRANAPLLLRNKDNYQRWSKEFGNFDKALDYHGFMEMIPVRRPRSRRSASKFRRKKQQQGHFMSQAFFLPNQLHH